MNPQFPPVNPPSPGGYVPSAAPPPPGYGTPRPTARTRGIAVSSLVLGLIPPVTVGLILLLLNSPLYAWVASQALLFIAVVPLVYLVTASLALLFGYVVLDQTKRQPFEQRLRGTARFGMILGIVGFVVPGLGVCVYFVYIAAELGNVG